MSEENEVVEETTEYEVVEDTTEPVDESTEEPSEEEIDWKARALKAEEVAENYKKENLKHRRTSREVEKPPKEEVDESSKEFMLQEAFLDKREDVLYDFTSDIEDLTDTEWSNIKEMIPLKLDAAYKKASKEGRYVSKGELSDAMKNLISYAKSGRSKDAEIEQARVDAMKDKQNLEAAEISGIKGRKPKSVSEEVKRLIDEKGWSEAEAKEIIKARQERAQAYAPKHTI